MIKRTCEPELISLTNQFKAVALIGPRQSGKTTLVQAVFPQKPYANLEEPDQRRFAVDDPRGFLDQFPQGAVLDEVQRAPELFSWLQSRLDSQPKPGQFILTGSNNFLLQETITQSLAGRIAYQILLPFAISELPREALISLNTLLFKGTYPPVYDQPVAADTWYKNYLRTYVERDVRQLRNIGDLNTFERFLRLCAGRIGQCLNLHNLAIETGVDGKTVNAWLSVLEHSFILFRLPPHHRNFNKRVVKMPKLYFYDTGLVCTLLGIQDATQLTYHPVTGSIFENFIISELKKQIVNIGINVDLYFWRDNVGHEIDVIIDQADRLYPIEIKSGKTITKAYFKNLKFWQKISGNTEATIIYGGDQVQHRSRGLDILPWFQLPDIMKVLDYK